MGSWEKNQGPDPHLEDHPKYLIIILDLHVSELPARCLDISDFWENAESDPLVIISWPSPFLQQRVKLSESAIGSENQSGKSSKILGIRGELGE